MGPAASSAQTDRGPRATRRVDLKVEVGVEDHTNFYTGFSQNVSEGGLFIATYNLREVGTQVEVAFTLPNQYTVEATGTIRWIRDTRDADNHDAPPGLGIEFDQLTHEDRKQIRAFTEWRAPMFYPD